ncbi:hypothetical protein B0T20DRAFT_114637 [Sordaria brevicollis]|uniref:Uncharacterized protein n=1 Tax=Sordaria brevicollis TaxID=83679 RepID=A0AAE0PK64_SORBR|nr:hypothetical protein B0T20DRAFT_114637 [Sordaria brevicollis]
MKFTSFLFLTTALGAYAAPTGLAPRDSSSLAARNPDAPSIITAPPPTIRGGSRRSVPVRRDPQRGGGQAPPPPPPLNSRGANEEAKLLLHLPLRVKQLVREVAKLLLHHLLLKVPQLASVAAKLPHHHLLLGVKQLVVREVARPLLHLHLHLVRDRPRVVSVVAKLPPLLPHSSRVVNVEDKQPLLLLPSDNNRAANAVAKPRHLLPRRVALGQSSLKMVVTLSNRV